MWWYRPLSLPLLADEDGADSLSIPIYVIFPVPLSSWRVSFLIHVLFFFFFFCFVCFLFKIFPEPEIHQRLHPGPSLVLPVDYFTIIHSVTWWRENSKNESSEKLLNQTGNHYQFSERYICEGSLHEDPSHIYSVLNREIKYTWGTHSSQFLCIITSASTDA